MLHAEQLIDLREFPGFTDFAMVDAQEIIGIFTRLRFSSNTHGCYTIRIELRGGAAYEANDLHQDDANSVAEQISEIWRRVLAEE